MPQKGEIRHGSTEDVVWDGSRWNPTKPDRVDTPASFGPLDYVPGLRDILNLPINAVKGAQALPDVARGLINDPAATLKGFAKGSSEAATPGRVGLLALLTGGATLPAAVGAAGGEALAQGTRLATDAPNAPKSFPEAALNVGEAASVPGIAAALQGIPAGVERLGGTKNLAKRVVGAGLGGYAGYKADGLPGALVGAAGGAMAPSMRGILRGALGVGEAEAAPVAAASEAEAAGPMTKGDWISAREGRFPFQKEELPYRMEGNPSQNPAELFPYQKDLAAEARSGPSLPDPRDPAVMDSPSMRGLQKATSSRFEDILGPEGPVAPFEMDGIRYAADPSGSHVAVPSDALDTAARDSAVSRYLDASPDNAFSRLRDSMKR